MSDRIPLLSKETEKPAMRDLLVRAEPHGGDLANLTVLVIDDDPALSRLIERSLEADARVLQHYDLPDEGELDLTGIDLVILDYVLPTRDGLMLLEEIRSLSEEIPVIFMTGYGDGEIARKAIELGADEYLAKPFEPVVLRRVANRLSRDAVDQDDDSTFNVSGGQNPRIFRGCDERGEVFEGNLESFDARSALIEVEGSGRFSVGELISDASVVFGSSKLSFTAARVENVTMLQGREQLTIQLTRGWLVADRDEKNESVPYLGVHSEEGERDREELPGNLRLAAIDLAAVFREIHDDVTSFEVSLDQYPPSERVEVEERFLRHAKGTLYRRLTEAVVQFEQASSVACSMGYERNFKGYSRKLLYPHVLSSPFMSRIVERPIGVPGDFDMLGQILGTRFRGHSLFGRLINEWILSNPATEAYRHRVQLLEDQTRKAVKAASEKGCRARILSMASGVAYEVQRYVKHPEEGGKVEFTLVDFSDETLDEARRQFGDIGVLSSEVSVAFEQSSVIELANSSRSGVSPGASWSPDGRYDFVYCAGLFDYLSDRMIVSVTKYLNTLVADGGALVVCNYTTMNPFAHFMGLVLDWELIYRSENHFEGLMRKALGDGNFRLTTDRNGVEVYGIAQH